MDVDLLEQHSRRLRSRKKLQGEPINNYTREERFNNRYSVRERKKQYDALGDPFTSYYFSNRSVKEHLKKFKKAIREEPNLTEKKRINQLLTARIRESFKEYVCPRTQVYEKEMNSLELDILNKNSTGSLTKMKSKQSLASYASRRHRKQRIEQKKINRMEPLNPSQQFASLAPHSFESVSRESESIDPVRKQFKEGVLPRNPKLITPITTKRREETANTHMLPQTQRSVEFGSRIKTTNREANQQKEFADKLAEELHRKKHDKWLKFLEEKKKLFLKGKEEDAPVVASKQEEANPEKSNKKGDGFKQAPNIPKQAPSVPKQAPQMVERWNNLSNNVEAIGHGSVLVGQEEKEIKND